MSFTLNGIEFRQICQINYTRSKMFINIYGANKQMFCKSIPPKLFNSFDKIIKLLPISANKFSNKYYCRFTVKPCGKTVFFFERICVKLFQLRARFYFKESYSTNIDSTFTHPLQAMKVVLISGIVYHARRYAQFNKSTWFSVKITIQQLRIPYPRRMIKPTKCLATSNVSLSNMFRQYSENK